MKVTYDPYLKGPAPGEQGRFGEGQAPPPRHKHPQKALWAKCWVSLAQGLTWEETSAAHGVAPRTLAHWMKSARFKKGVARAQKHWDEAAIKREIGALVQADRPETKPQDW